MFLTQFFFSFQHDNYSSENPVVVLLDAVDFSELKEESGDFEERDEEIDHAMSTLVPQQIASERRGTKRSKTSYESREDGDRFKIMANVPSSAPTQKDEYSLFGEQLACKLRKMEPILRLETQHKINCVVFEAEMKMAQKPEYDS